MCLQTCTVWVLNETTLVSVPPLHSCQLRRRMVSLLSQHVCADCRVGCDPFRVEPPPLRYGQQHICTFRLVTLYTCAECRAVYDHAGLYPRTCIICHQSKQAFFQNRGRERNPKYRSVVSIPQRSMALLFGYLFGWCVFIDIYISISTLAFEGLD